MCDIGLLYAILADEERKDNLESLEASLYDYCSPHTWTCSDNVSWTCPAVVHENVHEKVPEID